MNKTVLITGASSGIGYATAIHFANQGWNVVAGVRNPENSEVDKQHKNIVVVQLDVTDRKSIQTAINATLERFGSVDALVNSAGYGLMGVFEAASPDQIRDQYEVNVFGMMNTIQAVLPNMRTNAGGTIINISSFSGVVALPFGTLYNSSKFAVEGFSEALYHEVGPFNIRVKIIEPGSIETNFRKNMVMIENSIAEYNPIQASFFPRYVKATEDLPKNKAIDVAQTIFLACSDESAQLRYLSGKDAEFYIKLRRENNDDQYLDKIKQYFNYS